MRRNILVAAALTTVLFTVTGCAEKLVESKIADGIKQRLPDMVGPAQSYDVKVDGTVSKMLQGKIRSVEIKGTGVRPGGKFYLDEFNIVLKDIKANTDTQTVESVADTTFAAVVKEASLNKYLAKSRPDLRDLTVDVTSGTMLVHTRPSISRFSTSVDLSGVLKIERDTKLRYVVDRLTVAGINTPGFVADYVENKINPVLDISDFKFPAKLDSVKLDTDSVKIDGTADLTKGLPSK